MSGQILRLLGVHAYFVVNGTSRYDRRFSFDDIDSFADRFSRDKHILINLYNYDDKCVGRVVIEPRPVVL